MAALTTTTLQGGGSRAATENTLTSSDTFTIENGKRAFMILFNPTGSTITPTLSSGLTDPALRSLLEGAADGITATVDFVARLDGLTPAERWLALNASTEHLRTVTMIAEEAMPLDLATLALNAASETERAVHIVLGSDDLTPEQRMIALATSSDLQRAIRLTLASDSSPEAMALVLATSTTIAQTIAASVDLSGLTDEQRAFLTAITGTAAGSITLGGSFVWNPSEGFEAWFDRVTAENVANPLATLATPMAALRASMDALTAAMRAVTGTTPTVPTPTPDPAPTGGAGGGGNSAALAAAQSAGLDALAVRDDAKLDLERARRMYGDSSIAYLLLMPYISRVSAANHDLRNARDRVIALGGVPAFAKGGVPTIPSLSAAADQIVTRPTLFQSAGLMGEAGPEAIMPMVAGGVRAVGPDGETVLPLARAASGHLAVQLDEVAAFARGGVPAKPEWEAASPKDAAVRALAQPQIGMPVAANDLWPVGAASQAETPMQALAAAMTAPRQIAVPEAALTARLSADHGPEQAAARIVASTAFLPPAAPGEIVLPTAEPWQMDWPADPAAVAEQVGADPMSMLADPAGADTWQPVAPQPAPAARGQAAPVDTAEMERLLAGIRAELKDTREMMRQLQGKTMAGVNKLVRINEDWDANGLPAERV